MDLHAAPWQRSDTPQVRRPARWPICTEPQHPDGYNGIIETNLSTVHAMAVDYGHRRICFDVSGPSQTAASPGMEPMPARGAWSRFNYLRPP